MRLRARAGSNRWLRTLYAELNKEFFGNNLPKRLCIEWARPPYPRIARVLWERKSDGTYIPLKLQVHEIMKPSILQKKVGFSMLHEMVHIKLGPAVECEEWDGKFDKEMFSLAKRGAFRLFW